MSEARPINEIIGDAVPTPRLDNFIAMLADMKEKQTPIPEIVTVIMKAWRGESDAMKDYVRRLERHNRELIQAAHDYATDVVPVEDFDRIERKRRLLADEVRNLRNLIDAMTEDPTLLPAESAMHIHPELEDIDEE